MRQLGRCGGVGRTIFIQAGGTSTMHPLCHYEVPLSDVNAHKSLILI